MKRKPRTQRRIQEQQRRIRVQQQLATIEIGQKNKLAIENERAKDQINVFEASTVEESKTASSWSIRLNVISSQRLE